MQGNLRDHGEWIAGIDKVLTWMQDRTKCATCSSLVSAIQKKMKTTRCRHP